MEIEDVNTLMLEPFNLHSSDPVCHHNPSDYLSTNFKFYASDHEDESSTLKNESDMDALWTKAVDNMFKSSRLFNSNIVEEEKENVTENVLDSVISNMGTPKNDDNGIIKDNSERPGLVESLRNEDLGCTVLHESADTIPTVGKTALESDQTVPSSLKPIRKSSNKRKHQDLDVNFDLLVSTSFPPSIKYENKRLKLADATETEGVNDAEIQDGWSIPPKNCVAVDYSFDSLARLPSFREAFVPAIKKIAMKTKELKRKNKARSNQFEKQVTMNQGHPKMETAPVQQQSFLELEDHGIRTSTGGALLDSDTNPAVILSEVNEVELLNSANSNQTGKISNENSGPNLPKSEQEVHKDIYESSIKQEKEENMSDCARNTHDSITETPSKLFGLNSANLKDIEKDIFSFDEGLEMLDLDKDFSLQNITSTSIMDSVDYGVNQDPDWSFALSHGSDVHGVTESAVKFAQNDKMVANENLVIENKGLLEDSGIQPNAQSASFIQNRPMNGMDMINMEQNNMQMSMGMMKRESPSRPPEHGNFDILGHMQQQIRQTEMQETNHNNLNAIFNKDFPPDLKLVNNQQYNFRNQNPSSLDGQMIAQQIHQSFGADIFGCPGDNGAKILAKYLAQRGSMRPGDEKPKVNVTSAIASLIGKSFDEQEANQKLARDTSGVDFINSSDLEHLDFISDQF